MMYLSKEEFLRSKGLLNGISSQNISETYSSLENNLRVIFKTNMLKG